MSEPFRRKLVAGNWKMNATLASGGELVRGIAYLCAVAAAIQGSAVELGAQDVYFEPPGAFTGEVAACMLTDVGCRYVIVGHSERRHILGETDSLIHRKVAAAIAGGLKVILCVGEQLAEREAHHTESVLETQMGGGLAKIDESSLANLA